MAVLNGFSPVGSDQPRILILGSFPSVKSLERGEYYGHGRNQFWALLGQIFGFDPSAPYTERLLVLEYSGITLWDVIGACEREGSLDQDIRDELPNPLAEYIRLRPAIERIALNGGKAASSFITHVAPELKHLGGTLATGLLIGEPVMWRPSLASDRRIRVMRLPSSSPVPSRGFRNTFDKLPAWSAILG